MLSTDVIIMDFSKAFDKVSHNRLLYKLEKYGITGDTLLWIRAFLNNRQQCVVVDGERSEFTPVLSGVPQGSVIGPILFLVYINDLPDNIRSTVRLFADDTIIYLAVTSDVSCKQLEMDLDALQEWEITWRMEFNTTKCEVMRISRSKQQIQHTYYLHGDPLTEVKQTKYLGVHISHDLKWNKHINDITAKANRSLGFLKRNLRINSPSLKAKAYQGLVRPKLEYCASVWDPRPRVQSRAARWFLRRYGRTDSVTAMREELGWRSLEQRRADSRLTTLFKITRGLLSVDTKGLLRPVTRQTRRTHAESFIPLCTPTTSEHLSFFPRTIIQWNNLPASMFNNLSSLTVFKEKLICVNHLPVN